MSKSGSMEEDLEAEFLARSSIVDAAEQGARKGVRESVLKAPAEDVAVDSVADENTTSRVAGVLLLDDAKTAAADGALRGIASMEQYFRASISRFACLGYSRCCDISRLQSAATSGAATGVKAVALMLAGGAEGDGSAFHDGMDPDLVVASAGVGARAGRLSVGVHLIPGFNPALLGPLLGGSLPASAAAYHLLRTSSNTVKACVFGAIGVGVFFASIGLIAGFVGKTQRWLNYNKLASLVTITIYWVLLTFAFCSMFTERYYRIAGGIVGGISLLLLFTAWFRSGW